MTGLAVDTSVLLPALIGWHEAHEPCRTAIEQGPIVPAQVFAECYSVLTRLPAPHRLAPADAAQLVGGIGLPVKGLSAAKLRGLITDLGRRGIRGGAVYDALIGATARYEGAVLLTRDRRAVSTYESVGASCRWV